MNRSVLLLVALLLGLAGAPFPQPPASASCAAPYLLETDGVVLDRGSGVTVEGRAFTGGGCQDSMGCTGILGCQRCTYDDPPAVPLQDVGLRLHQHDRSWTLGTSDAGTAADDHLGWVTWTFELPAEVQPGPARLVADGAAPVRIRVR